MTILFTGARKLDALGQVDDFWMLVDGDTIVSTGSGVVTAGATAPTRIDLAGRWLVPGFMDLHSHGGGGHSFDDGPDAVKAGLASHRAHGTTRSVVSLVANPIERLKDCLAGIADLASDDPLILGSHLEGPYLALERRGAHNAEFVRDPQPAELEALIGAARGTLRQVTIAPELPNALDAVDVLVEEGVVVGVGHTNADLATTMAAFDRGARLLTHAFNAMPGIHHRAPGPVIAAFEDERVVIELIVDGLHVDPRVVELVFRSATARVALITDAMAAAGSVDGDYTLGSQNVSVRDGLAMLRGTATFAGSTLTQDRALRVAIHEAGIAPAAAVEALTLTPARALGLESRHGLLAPGFAADAVILDNHMNVAEVWANGNRIHTVG